MARYYAITCREGQWVYVSAGGDPVEVFRTAQDMLDRRDEADNEPVFVSPETERSLNNLLVVPADTARERYHMRFTHELED